MDADMDSFLILPHLRDVENCKQCFVVVRFMHTVYMYMETNKQTIAIKEDGSDGLSVVISEQRVATDSSLSDIGPVNSVV